MFLKVFIRQAEIFHKLYPCSLVSLQLHKLYTNAIIAEDYYGADYPEDEVASDDEYDRDAYQYRKNADDLEEFDIHENYDPEHDDDELARSDDEGEFESKLFAARAWKRDFAKTASGDVMRD